MVVFIDDILVYSKTREEHEEYLRIVRTDNFMLNCPSVSFGWRKLDS